MSRLLNHYNARQLAELYRSQLQEIMQEWGDHTMDKENGGYLTNFDEYWNITGSVKNIWAQARQTYMFSAMYSLIQKEERWLELAKAGRDFLVAHAYAGNGRWNYELNSDGTEVLKGITTVFTDFFVLSALSQYAVASGSREDLPLIEETFLAVQRNILDPSFKDINPHQWYEGIVRHPIYMIAVNSLGVAGQVLGRPQVKPFIKLCTDKLLNFFGKNSSGYLLESLKEDGSVWDTEEGRLVIPGHIFEGMWFCIDEARKDGDQSVLPRSLKIIDAACEKAIDITNGGILHRFDCFNKPSMEVLHTDTGLLRPDNKVDWVHCETLYTFALTAVLTEDDGRFRKFWELHEYCQQYFHPKTGGDWYPLLAADGEVLRKNKGGKHRVAFHVPRALMNLALLFQKYSEGNKG